jgi:hypothetical protein
LIRCYTCRHVGIMGSSNVSIIRDSTMADHDPPYRPASRPPYELSVTRSDILTGRLVRLSEHSLRVAYCHYAVYPTASESNPALVSFRDWLVEEASRS